MHFVFWLSTILSISVSISNPFPTTRRASRNSMSDDDTDMMIVLTNHDNTNYVTDLLNAGLGWRNDPLVL